MNRAEAIETIQQLYPVDSQYSDVAETGRQLLDQARNEILAWKNQPTEVLIRYAELCINVEQANGN